MYGEINQILSKNEEFLKRCVEETGNKQIGEFAMLYNGRSHKIYRNKQVFFRNLSRSFNNRGVNLFHVFKTVLLVLYNGVYFWLVWDVIDYYLLFALRFELLFAMLGVAGYYYSISRINLCLAAPTFIPYYVYYLLLISPTGVSIIAEQVFTVNEKYWGCGLFGSTNKRFRYFKIASNRFC